MLLIFIPRSGECGPSDRTVRKPADGKGHRFAVFFAVRFRQQRSAGRTPQSANRSPITGDNPNHEELGTNYPSPSERHNFCISTWSQVRAKAQRRLAVRSDMSSNAAASLN